MIVAQKGLLPMMMVMMMMMMISMHENSLPADLKPLRYKQSSARHLLHDVFLLG
jgi:hypothetical protein